MSQNNHIQDELSGLNSKLPVSKQPFSVPEGYFEDLAATVLNRIKAGEQSAASEIEALSPLLAGISRQVPYTIPDGYLEQNIADLPFIVGEVDESTSLLSGISREMPQSVPNGYFENLPGTLLQRTVPAKVVPITSRRWMRMAVAATIAGVMAIAGYFYVAGNNGSTSDGLTRELKTVSTTELDEFINNTAITSGTGQTANNRPKPRDVEYMLQDVSDKELDAFLNGIPSAEDDLFAIN